MWFVARHHILTLPVELPASLGSRCHRAIGIEYGGVDVFAKINSQVLGCIQFWTGEFFERTDANE